MASRRCPSGSPSRRRAPAISPAPRWRRASSSALGLDRTIGIGALALAIGGPRQRCGDPARRRFADPARSPRWRSSRPAWAWCSRRPIAGAMMPFPHRAGTASSLVGVSQMVCAAASGVDRRASARRERLAGRDPARALGMPDVCDLGDVARRARAGDAALAHIPEQCANAGFRSRKTYSFTPSCFCVLSPEYPRPLSSSFSSD